MSLDTEYTFTSSHKFLESHTHYLRMHLSDQILSELDVTVPNTWLPIAKIT
jgi:hypothetical protein